jgi:hypothetical protein
MADGLTVPFALAAGLSAAVSSTKVIVTAGIAEIIAGAIAMGLGGYPSVPPTPWEGALNSQPMQAESVQSAIFNTPRRK